MALNFVQIAKVKHFYPLAQTFVLSIRKNTSQGTAAHVHDDSWRRLSGLLEGGRERRLRQLPLRRKVAPQEISCWYGVRSTLHLLGLGADPYYWKLIKRCSYLPTNCATSTPFRLIYRSQTWVFFKRCFPTTNLLWTDNAWRLWISGCQMLF